MRILFGYVILFCLYMALLSLADETSAGQPTADLGEHVIDAWGTTGHTATGNKNLTLMIPILERLVTLSS